MIVYIVFHKRFVLWFTLTDMTFKSLHFHFQVIEEFKNIFGPELEAVTGDPKRIEEVLVRVDNLVKPLEDVSTCTGGCHVKVWKA